MVSGSLPSTYLASEVRELGRVLAEAMEAQPLRDLGRPPAADDAVDAGPRVLVPALPSNRAFVNRERMKRLQSEAGGHQWRRQLALAGDI